LSFDGEEKFCGVSWMTEEIRFADFDGFFYDIATEDAGVTFRGTRKSGENAEKRGFAGAVGTEEPEDNSARDGEGHTVKRTKRELAAFLVNLDKIFRLRVRTRTFGEFSISERFAFVGEIRKNRWVKNFSVASHRISHL